MNGCSYLQAETGEPLAWTNNYNSQIWQELYKKGYIPVIVEEPYYKHLERQYNENKMPMGIY